MFKIGDDVVYKKDVCEIKDIKKYNDTEYYILIPISDSSLKISVPVENKNGFLRNIISKEEVMNIIASIPSIGIIKSDNKLIENDYKRLINSDTHEDLIKIIKTSYLRNKERTDNNKKTSDKDTNYLRRAEEYLYNEFSVVLGMDYDQTKSYVISEVKKING